MSTNDTNPGTFLGGTWQRIKDTFLLAAGDYYQPGVVGGAATQTLSTSNLPSHKHTFSGTRVATEEAGAHTHSVTVSRTTYYDNFSSGGADMNLLQKSSGEVHTIEFTSTGTAASAGKHSHYFTPSGTISNTGGGEAFSIMPPYIGVYIWKRTA